MKIAPFDVPLGKSIFISSSSTTEHCQSTARECKHLLLHLPQVTITHIVGSFYNTIPHSVRPDTTMQSYEIDEEERGQYYGCWNFPSRGIS